jgi:hypothetical protein
VIEKAMPLDKIQSLCWICMGCMSIGSLIFASWQFALSVVAGGLVSTVSFYFATREIRKMTTAIGEEPSAEERQVLARQGQRGYLLKFFIRIVIIGVVLLLLIRSDSMDIFGLVLGLSTVVLAVTLAALDMARHYFFSGRR